MTKNVSQSFHENFFVSDKTELFSQIINSQKSRPQLKMQTYQHLRESSKIEVNLKYIKEKLAELEKGESLFLSFNSDEEKIDSLTSWINQKIKETQLNINELSNFSDMRSNKQSETIAKSISDILQSRLMESTQSFKKLLQRRTQAIKQMDEKKNRYQNFSSISIKQKNERLGAKNKPMFLKVGNGNQIIDIENSGNGNSEYNNDSEDFRPIKLQEEEIQHLESRAGAMKNIESMIKETAHVFQRLGNIVKMQEVMIDRIDKETDDALQNVEKGRKVLTQAYRDISSNRGLIIRVLAILVVFITIYIVFLL